MKIRHRFIKFLIAFIDKVFRYETNIKERIKRNLSPFKSTVQWVYISLQNTHDCDALEFFPPAADPAVGSQFEKSKSYGINITLGYESSPAF